MLKDFFKNGKKKKKIRKKKNEDQKLFFDDNILKNRQINQIDGNFWYSEDEKISGLKNFNEN